MLMFAPSVPIKHSGHKIREIGLQSAILHPEYVSWFNESVSHFGFWRHDLISQLERRLINMSGLGATAAKREMGRRMNDHRRREF